MRDKSSVLTEIHETEVKLQDLRRELEQVEAAARVAANNKTLSTKPWRWPLQAGDYERYGRQMIMPEIGLQGQLKLKASSVLIVGVGGLGCPAAAYLAGTGIKRLGLVDGDTVEVSNLHRQILHTTDRIGVPKVHSAVTALERSNPTIEYEPHASHLTPQTALDLFSQYDLILDCTDHPASRYLISDGAVLAGKPLVSASALKTDGQLVVLNNPPTPPLASVSQPSSACPPVSHPAGGPCYRCIFPKPPPPDSVVSCGEGGILGPVVGTMGVLMALEAIKVLTGDPPATGIPTNMTIFSGYATPQFRNLRMKGKRADCVACGKTRTVTAESLTSGSLDYIAFCGVTNPVRVLDKEERISVEELKMKRETLERTPTIIDVREETQFELAHLPNSTNIPFSEFESGKAKDKLIGEDGQLKTDGDGSLVLFMCRLGNDSQIAAQKLKTWSCAAHMSWIGDVEGGFRAWKDRIEPDWPDY